MTDEELKSRARKQSLALQERDPAASAYGDYLRAKRSGIDPIVREAARVRAILISNERHYADDDPGVRGVSYVAGPNGLETRFN